MIAYQQNINAKRWMFKVEDNFIESPLFDLCLQFKFSNYYSVQYDVKLTYHKKEWHQKKLPKKLHFIFLGLPSILNIMVFKYLNLKSAIIKIKSNFIQSPLFGIQCPHFDFSHY